MSDTEHATVSKRDKNDRIDGGRSKDGQMDGRMGDAWLGLGWMEGRKDDG